MKKQEKRTKVIMAIAKAYETGNTALTNRLEAIVIPNEEALPKELQKVLDSWGNNPIEEPEFFESLKSAELEDLKQTAIKDLDIDAFSALDIALLAKKVNSKITDKIDKNGSYKTTPNIDKVTLPKTTQLRAIKKLAKDGADDEAIEKEIFKIAGVKKKELIEWEQTLVRQMLYAFIEAVDKDTISSYSDRTPFARYIKNV